MKYFLIVIIFLIFFPFPTGFNSFICRTQNKNFCFSDFGDPEKMESELYELHPPGSDFVALHSTLKAAGYWHDTSKHPRNDPNVELYGYNRDWLGFFKWGVVAVKEGDSIKEIKVYEDNWHI